MAKSMSFSTTYWRISSIFPVPTNVLGFSIVTFCKNTLSVIAPAVSAKKRSSSMYSNANSSVNF